MSFSAPVPLQSDHSVAEFDCGQPALSQWLVRHGMVNQQRRAWRTFVVCVDHRVVGYYALAAGSVIHAEATDQLRRNMPDPVPMALLGRLAVDRSAHGMGVGAGLLKDAVLRVLLAADLLGVRGILVDAIDDKARLFYEHFGFRPSAVLPLKLMVTLDEIERRIGA